MGNRLAGVSAALAALLLVVALASAQGDPLSAEERAWIDANGPILYAPDPDYPPFEFVDDGVVKGINMDFLNRMSRNLDIEFQVVVYDNWTAVLDAMRAREVHMLGSLAQNEERDEYMDFIGPYMQVGEVFYVNTERTDLRGLEDLTGKRVAVVQNYAAAAWLAENRPDLELVPVPDMLSGLEAVSTGTVDAFFENVPVAGYNIRERAISNVKILGDPLYYSPANWAVQKDHDILHGIVSKGLASIPPGEQTAIFEYWSGYDLGITRAPADGPLFSPLAIAVLGGLGAVMVAGGAWVLTLRRVVRTRTEDLRLSNNEIRRANEDLAHRVEERAMELRSLTEQEGRIFEALEKHATAATRLVDRSSWELKNRYHGILRPDTRKAVQRSSAACWDTMELVAATADTAKTEAIAPGDPCPLGPTLRAAAEQYARQRDVQVDIDCDEDLMLPWPPRTMQRLAARFVAFAGASASGEPAVRVTRSDGAIRVAFPNASAIADPALLVEPLRHEGFGLSLPAVARMVHRAGGDVQVDVIEGQLTMTLSIPDGPVGDGAEAPQSRSAAARRGAVRPGSRPAAKPQIEAEAPPAAKAGPTGVGQTGKGR